MISPVLKFGFEELGLNRIALGVFDFNKSAIKCYKNMGFKLEGTLRQSAKVRRFVLELSYDEHFTQGMAG